MKEGAERENGETQSFHQNGLYGLLGRGNGLLGRGNISHMPKMDSIKEVVNSFSEFFYSKVQTIRDGLDRLAATSDYVVENLQTAPLKHHLTSFDEASENEIQRGTM